MPDQGMTGALEFGNNFQPTGERRHRRARLSLAAQVETVTSRLTAQLTSLSRSGACVRLAPVPKVGSDVLLRCGAVEAFGNVVWSGPSACGIRFAELVTDQTVVAVRLASDRQPEIVTSQRLAAAKAWAQGAAA